MHALIHNITYIYTFIHTCTSHKHIHIYIGTCYTYIRARAQRRMEDMLGIEESVRRGTPMRVHGWCLENTRGPCLVYNRRKLIEGFKVVKHASSYTGTVVRKTVYGAHVLIRSSFRSANARAPSMATNV